MAVRSAHRADAPVDTVRRSPRRTSPAHVAGPDDAGPDGAAPDDGVATLARHADGPSATSAGPQTVPASPVLRASPPPRGPAAARAVARLTGRLIRRGLLALVLALVAYALLEVAAFEVTYPDAASREMVARFGEDPAVRILTGMPAGTSIGALVVWDNGWMIQLIVGVWVVVTASRLLRGDEDTGRSELVLAGPLRARSALGAQLAVLLAACVVVGTALGVAIAAAGTAGVGSVLYGAQVAGFAAVHLGLTAVLSQVLPSRGRVVGVASSALFAAVLLRMVGNSADARAWVHWLTPLGWADKLEPYADDRWQVLLIPVTVTAVLAVAALLLRGRRDHGAGLLGERRTERSRLVGLSSPMAFAARSTAGTLVSWAVGLASFGVVGGLMLPAMNEFLESDPGYAELLAAFGFDLTDVTRGYISMMAVMAGVTLSLFVVWRIGAARTEEATERLEQILVRPVRRVRWLGGHLLLAVASLLVLVAVEVAALWGTAQAVDAELSLTDTAAAALNPLPAVAVVLGLAVLLLGLAPRWVVPVGATTAMLLYVVELLGPALEWPEWVLAVSPFHHLAVVPVEDYDTAAGVGLLAVAVLLTTVGVVAFRRRDLRGA